MFRFTKLTAFIKKHLIDDVPSDLAACEICRIETCSNDKWTGCKNRLDHKERLDNLKK